MSFLTIVQDAAVELGLSKPNTVFGSSDLSLQKLTTAMQQVGQDLMRSKEWPHLRIIDSITLASGTESYSTPADFDRFVTETHWDGSSQWPVLGSLSPQEWALIKYGTTAVGPFRRYTVFGDPLSIKISPTPGTGDTGVLIYFTYVSNNFCESAGGTGQSAWALDTDLSRLPDRLFMLGAKARWLRVNGLDWQDAEAEYRAETDRVYTQSISARTINLAGRNGSLTKLSDESNIPDGGYG